MKMNKKIMMLAVIAAFMMVAVPVVATQDGVNAETGDISADGITVNFVKDVDYGDYGKAANSTTTTGVDSLGNSITVTYDGASKTFTFTGSLVKQDLTDNTKTFNKLGSPADKPYGIVFEITVPNAGDKIKVGEGGSEGTATAQDLKFQSLLYLGDTTTPVQEVIKYTPNSSTTPVMYKFNLTGLYEAKIGSTYYLTLTDALSAATTTNTVELLKDISSGYDYVIPAGVTLDGKNKTLTLNGITQPASTSSKSDGRHGLIDITKEGGITIKNVQFVRNCQYGNMINTFHTDESSYSTSHPAACVHLNGSLTIQDCTFSSTYDGTSYGNYIQIYADSGAVLSVTGCTFNDTAKINRILREPVFYNDSTASNKVVFSGCTFNTGVVSDGEAIKVTANSPATSLADGFVSVTNCTLADGYAPVIATTTTSYTWAAAKAEAKIGDVYYATLEDAVAATNYPTNETTITIIDDVVLDAPLELVGKFKLVGAAKTSGMYSISASNSFTSTAVEGWHALIHSLGDGTHIAWDANALTIENITIDGNSKVAPMVINGGSFTMTSGVIQGGKNYDDSHKQGGLIITAAATFTMNGGEIKDGAGASPYDVANSVWIGSNASATIKGKLGKMYVNANSSGTDTTVTINTGADIATVRVAYYSTNPGKLTFTDGTIASLLVENSSESPLTVAPVKGLTYYGGMTYDAVSNSVYYVNLKDALDLVGSGTITLNKAAVTVDETLSIKSGVTLETSTNILTISANGILNVSGTLKDAYASDATAKTIDNKGKINVLAGGKMLVGYQPAVTGVNIDGKINVVATGLLQCNDGSDTKLIGGNDAVINLTAGSIDFDAKSVGGAVAYTLNTASEASINAFPFKSGDSITIDGELTAVDNVVIPTGVTMTVNGDVVIESAKSIVITGTGAVTVSSEGAITGGTIDFTDATLGSKVLTVENGGMLTTILDGSDAAVGEQPAKPSKMELKSVVAGANGIIIAKGSVVIDGTYTTDDDGTITITSGTATITGTVDEGVKIVVPAGVTVNIPAGGTLEFDAGSSFENSGTINFESPTSSTIIYEEGSTVNGVEIEVTTKQTEGGVIVAIIITLKTANADKLLLKVDGQYLEVYYVEAFEGDSYADALAGIEVESLKSRVSFDGWYNVLNEKVTSDMTVGAVAPTLTAKFTETPREGVTPHTPSIEPTVITVDETSGYDNTTMLVAAVAMLVVAIFVLGYVVIVKRK